MNPKDRCLALLEIKRQIEDLWPHAPNEHDKTQLENMLMTLRPLMRDWCKEAQLPFG